MLACTFLAVCERVIEDAESHTWTIVALVEQASFEAFGAVVPWSTISYWDIDPAAPGNRNFLVRHVLVAADGSRAVESPAFPVTFAGRRTRLNLRGFTLPRVPGDYDVRMEWSPGPNAGWRDAGLRWSLRLNASGAAAAAEPAQVRH